MRYRHVGLDTWYRRLTRHGVHPNEIRFIIRAKHFIEMPNTAKSAIYWREGEYYYVAMNHRLVWMKNLVAKNEDIEGWENEAWQSKPKFSKSKRGRPRKNDKEPDICKERSAAQIQKMLDRKRISAMINSIRTT